MNRLQLATLISWAGESGLHGRKRLQKVVFFLQEAGCPLDCQYTLHHFGPYSRDVADACDELVSAELAEEVCGPVGGSGPYRYTLSSMAEDFLRQEPDPSLSAFEELGKQLINEDLWHLELGSTVLFYYRQTKDWDRALERACAFKKVSSTIEASQRALELAQRLQRNRRN
ncbi:MAG: hypothetical protein ACK55O_14410 [Phycisphaerales bacterium]|nr:hypothetical protein [Phycisphaeraceae bacterium]